MPRGTKGKKRPADVIGGAVMIAKTRWSFYHLFDHLVGAGLYASVHTR